jgi:NAD dependent epimerase/dehydratase family enzyme
VLGEGALVVTEGQRVLPEATLAAGYTFRFPELAPALADVAGA